MSKRYTTPFGPSASGASGARKPGIPVFAGHAAHSISFTFTTEGNDPRVTYSIRARRDLTGGGTFNIFGYVKSDGTIGASEVYRTAAEWGATVTVTGLADFVAYNFAAQAKNEMGATSGYSDPSAPMNTLPDIDEGVESDTLAREVTSGNVKVDATLGLEVSGAIAEEFADIRLHGDITVKYTLQSYGSETASVEIEFSEDDGDTWATASQWSGGPGKTDLATSPKGTAHEFRWDSYTDAGASEYQTSVKLRIRALDATGDAGAWVVSEPFVVYNRPEKPVLVNADGREWDEDTTPVFEAVMPRLRGGGPGYPVIRIYSDAEGTALVDGYPARSVDNVAGWEHETEAGVWQAVSVMGIDGTYCNGKLKMRYTVQAALATGTYLVTMTMGEARDRG